MNRKLNSHLGEWQCVLNIFTMYLTQKDFPSIIRSTLKYLLDLKFNVQNLILEALFLHKVGKLAYKYYTTRTINQVG